MTEGSISLCSFVNVIISTEQQTVISQDPGYDDGDITHPDKPTQTLVVPSGVIGALSVSIDVLTTN